MFKKTLTTCILLLMLLNFSCTSLQNHSTETYASKNPLELLMVENIRFNINHPLVKHGIYVIEPSEPILRELIHSDRVPVIGMLYDMETGKVDILEQ